MIWNCINFSSYVLMCDLFSLNFYLMTFLFILWSVILVSKEPGSEIFPSLIYQNMLYVKFKGYTYLQNKFKFWEIISRLEFSDLQLKFYFPGEAFDSRSKSRHGHPNRVTRLSWPFAWNYQASALKSIIKTWFFSRYIKLSFNLHKINIVQ